MPLAHVHRTPPIRFCMKYYTTYIAKVQYIYRSCFREHHTCDIAAVKTRAREIAATNTTVRGFSMLDFDFHDVGIVHDRTPRIVGRRARFWMPPRRATSAVDGGSSSVHAHAKYWRVAANLGEVAVP